jgi:serine/threonine protein kinase
MAGLFGPWGNSINKLPEAAWCIANMICLAGPLPHPNESSVYKKDYELAEEYATAFYPSGILKLISWRHWRIELGLNQHPPVSEHLLDFIESLLVVDHKRRPNASEALQHPYFEIASDEEVGFKP